MLFGVVGKHYLESLPFGSKGGGKKLSMETPLDKFKISFTSSIANFKI